MKNGVKKRNWSKKSNISPWPTKIGIAKTTYFASLNVSKIGETISHPFVSCATACSKTDSGCPPAIVTILPFGPIRKNVGVSDTPT